ncbi:MAG: septal ring lytic transglycosylase RlpA family protein [Gammaproteobacteria bacterium]|nr:MAG: septal ring lytic transglycosylase RlpA family protein [Gammaproteobacteria bacterium]
MRRIDLIPPPLLAASATVLLATILLASCGTATRWEQPAPAAAGRDSGQPPRSRSGNPPFYEVFGQRYHVMASSAGYRERGVASWYGPDFHGKRTSSGERYDMHAMTAAHKTLPLPTRVRVTNLRNGRSVVVVVNDRGPFVDNRIIDLSYAAARRLDMIAEGTTLVEIEALPWDTAQPAAAVASGGAVADTGSAGPRGAGGPAEAVVGSAPDTALYLQLGAFGERANALALQRRLQAAGLSPVEIHHDPAAAQPLYRVRIGPVRGAGDYDALNARLAALGIHETQLVTAPPAPDRLPRQAAGCAVDPC